MSENRKLKEQVVVELGEKFNKSVTTVLVEYLGSTVSQLSQLRTDLRNNESEMKVYKNRLVKIAVTNNKLDGLIKHLLGPNATVFSYGDNVEAIRILGNHIKDNEFLKFKAGIFEGKIVDHEFLQTLSKIPSMDTLLTQIGSGLLQFVKQLGYGLTLLDESHLKKGEEKKDQPASETKETSDKSQDVPSQEPKPEEPKAEEPKVVESGEKKQPTPQTNTGKNLPKEETKENESQEKQNVEVEAKKDSKEETKENKEEGENK